MLSRLRSHVRHNVVGYTADVTVVVLTALALALAFPGDAVAQFQTEQPYTVSVVNSPSDGGKVTGEIWGNPDKIDCGTDCSAVVTNEPQGCDELGCADSWSIVLGAIPADGHALDRWEGCSNDVYGGAYDNSCYVYSSGEDLTG
jgi:hypothetical protein